MAVYKQKARCQEVKFGEIFRSDKVTDVLPDVTFNLKIDLIHCGMLKGGGETPILLPEQGVIPLQDAFAINFEQLWNYDYLKECIKAMLLGYKVTVFRDDSLDLVESLSKEIADEAFSRSRYNIKASEIVITVHLEVNNTGLYDNIREYNLLEVAETILGLLQTASMEEESMQKVLNAASRASIDALERTRYKKDERKEVTSCSICREDFMTDDEIRMMPCCRSHIFHTDCIGKWLEVSNICPLCRHQMPTEDPVST